MFVPLRVLLAHLGRDYSSLSLLLSNLIAIGVALYEGWPLSLVMWVYWWQSVIIGLFTFLKVLTMRDYSTEGLELNGKSPAPCLTINIFLAGFFAVHYGFFHFAYAQFLGEFGGETDQRYLAVTAGIFFLNHLFSFGYNRNRDRRKENMGLALLFPYARILPMHLTIMIGAPVSAFLGGSKILVVLFLLLKTYADLTAHYFEHEKREKVMDMLRKWAKRSR